TKLSLADDNRTSSDEFIGFCYAEETKRLGTTVSPVLRPLTYSESTACGAYRQVNPQAGKRFRTYDSKFT
ncbi:MAG: hypothetical protein HQ549_04445, partial [Candidatus Omnitrophica bacterium]|nr:hypothetical protein [Candidatus Omnitrophota bacterium]